jgi:hypothetical protein
MQSPRMSMVCNLHTHQWYAIFTYVNGMQSAQATVNGMQSAHATVNGMQSAHTSINSMQSAHASMGMAHMNNVNKKLCRFGESQSQRQAEIIWNCSNL